MINTGGEFRRRWIWDRLEHPDVIDGSRSVKWTEAVLTIRSRYPGV